MHRTGRSRVHTVTDPHVSLRFTHRLSKHRRSSRAQPASPLSSSSHGKWFLRSRHSVCAVARSASKQASSQTVRQQRERTASPLTISKTQRLISYCSDASMKENTVASVRKRYSKSPTIVLSVR